MAVVFSRILDGTSDRCDIYPCSSNGYAMPGNSGHYNPVELVESFVKFVETCINGLRRSTPKPVKVKASSVQPPEVTKAKSPNNSSNPNPEFRGRSATTAMFDR